MITVSGSQQTQFEARHLRMVMFAQLEFLAGDFVTPATIRVSTWNHDITWGSYTWQGLGNLVSVQDVKDSENLETSSVDLKLNAANSTILSMAMAEAETYRGRAALLYLCPVTDGGVLVDTPILFWTGEMDTLAVTYAQEGGEISMRCYPTSSRLARPSGLRANHEQHIQTYPTELGFQYLADLIAHPQVWLTKTFQASIV